MSEDKTQNQKESLAINIAGAILPIIYILLFIYQMIESFTQQ